MSSRIDAPPLRLSSRQSFLDISFVTPLLAHADLSLNDKESIRERMLQRRRNFSPNEQSEASDEVCRRLRSWSGTRDAVALGGYLSFDNEVDISAFLEERLDASALVALPRVEDGESMEYVDVAGLDEVEEGSFGILEPLGSPCDLGDLDVFLVPGVAFDRSGHRIGMGWGYYDRALARRRDADTSRDAIFVGVCYDFQLVEELPTEPHDVAMDAVVTRDEIVRCSRSEAS